MKQVPLTILVPIGPKQRSEREDVREKRQDVVREKRQALLLLGEQLERARTTPPSAQATAIEQDLRALLPEGGEDARTGIHYLSFFLIDAGPSPLVALELNCDGSAAAMIERLARVAPRFLQQLFAGCDGVGAAGPPPDARAWRRFLRRHAERSDAFFVAFPGRSVQQIRAEQQLRRSVRSEFEAVMPPSDPTPRCPLRASHGRSLRLSPTSASALWRLLRDGPAQADGSAPGAGFASDPLVREAAARPFLVRWSLGGGHWRQQLELWGRRLASALILGCTAAGLWVLAHEPMVLPAALLVALALAFDALWVGLIFFGTWREAPRSLGWRGHVLVQRGALWESVLATSRVAALVAIGALGAGVAAKLPAWVSMVSALALLGLIGGLLRARLGQTALGSALLVLLVAALLPTPLLALIPAAALAAVGVTFLVLVAAFFYVMVGRAAAVLIPLGLALAAGSLLAFGAEAEGVSLRLLGQSALGLLLLLVLAAGGGVAWLVLWFSAIRRAERRDAAQEQATNQPGRIGWDVDHLDDVQEREDTLLQNHLITVSRLKPGGLRLRTLERVLRAIQLIAKIYANRGDLGGIRTIHFARFMILPDRQHLLFIGNYDSGFGSYLQEFSGTSGATAVWSNCLRFPRAYFLVADGAGEEQRFKAFGRSSQVKTSGWYSAYPELSLGDIEAATLTREDLSRPLEDRTHWLGRLQARFGRALSEADCDLTLRRL